MTDNPKYIHFDIKGRLPSLNEYILAERGNKYSASALKKRVQKQIMLEILHQIPHEHLVNPVHIDITWVEPNSRRDIDNIAFAKKFILDALVAAKVIPDDSQKYVKSFREVVKVDKEHPRIEVRIMEIPSDDYLDMLGG